MNKKAATPADPIVRLVFADTIQARMFRTLCRRGSMPQAEFMTLYHARCHRPNPGKSSFANNFGRFLGLYGGSWREQRYWHRAIIKRSAVENRPGRNLLHWNAYHFGAVMFPREAGFDNVAAFIAVMTPEDRYLAFTAIEKLITAPREHVDDDPEDLVFWFRALVAPGFLADVQVAA